MAGNFKLIFIALLLSVSSASAQVSFNGGGSILKGFGPQKPYGGFHLGVEIPRDDAVSLYARFSHYFKQNDFDSASIYLTARDITALPPGSEIAPLVGAMPSMNYNILEGGTRYYLGDGFDYGFGAYGGSSLMLIFNKVRMTYEEYDEELYYVDNTSSAEGAIFSLGFGLMGGVKYSWVPFGTLYADLGINYMIFAQPSTQYVYPGMYNSLIFTFNIGYRKDLFW